MLQVRENNKTLYINIKKQFIKQVSSNINNKKKGNSLMPKPIDSSNFLLPPPIPLRLSKKDLNKSKFHRKNNKTQQKHPKEAIGCLYA